MVSLAWVPYSLRLAGSERSPSVFLNRESMGCAFVNVGNTRGLENFESARLGSIGLVEEFDTSLAYLDADAALAVSVLGAWGSCSMMRTPAHYSWQASGRRLGRLDWLRPEFLIPRSVSAGREN
ncbi:hypothetical protein PISMIDRAFT_478885 [Pisolithus microcarpus 441]|uniref:Uncharacterized protein n=1 Tax=Pisolithus microcarpus 441 TaxID=765257 RepID=A0A0C9Y3E1_9AGAM|nr:hypothetical protein PISMIDRAFT_478885 [Pisolithus microcarpus 441]